MLQNCVCKSVNNVLTQLDITTCTNRYSWHQC